MHVHPATETLEGHCPSVCLESFDYGLIGLIDRLDFQLFLDFLPYCLAFRRHMLELHQPHPLQKKVSFVTSPPP
jgi:hypothetical protein